LAKCVCCSCCCSETIFHWKPRLCGDSTKHCSRLCGSCAKSNITFSTGTSPTPSTSNFKQFGPVSTQPSQQATTQASIFGQNPPSGGITFGTVTSTAASVPGFGGTASSFGQSAPTTVASTGGSCWLTK
jgi:hypothetical protein